MDRVDCYLEAIEEIAPQSRRAARRRVEEATRRRNAIQTALPTGNEKSIGLGLHQGYPVTELSDALDALPPEEMDNFLQAFKTFQKTTVGRDRTDDMAQLLAEAGFTIDENNELMIDAEVEEGLVVSMNDLGFDTESEEPGSAEKKSRSRQQGSSAAGADGSGFVEESGESQASGEGGDSEYESGSGDSNSPAGRTSPDSAAEQERLLDEFILAKLMKVETERKINLTDPSTSWLDVADVVHTELLADVNKDMVEIYSSQYRKPVALSRKLRKLHKQMLAEKALETPHAELDAADLDLPGAPAPSIPDAPSVLVDDWSLDLPEIAPIKRRVSNKKSRSRAKASGTTQFQLRRSIHGSKAQKKELRPLHWNKISDKVVDKTAFAMAAPQVDLFEQLMEGTDEIDNLFASGARPTSDPMIHKVKSAGVLETKRQMNFEIMLSMFPDELQSIFDAIENLDPFKKRLSDDQVQILDNQPLSNEETKLGFQYSGGDEEFMELSHGEQFAILVARNSAFPKMVKAAAVLRSYRETVTELEEDARVLRRAVREVKSSESFRSFIAGKRSPTEALVFWS
uniref:FH2 domain-containing protein n=1 Tax=Rhodosorus marinus TaxID=101924 RepID=A0A7S3A8Z0_9RHOD|mmetsp:Transcript_7739/g.34348  ORF Transcript_7739/g.34348 Transcript_7739/m.34348 type:complete len:571 (+) Transcript_7739:1329-3041(+)